jgi:hypothetical protein
MPNKKFQKRREDGTMWEDPVCREGLGTITSCAVKFISASSVCVSQLSFSTRSTNFYRKHPRDNTRVAERLFTLSLCLFRNFRMNKMAEVA